MLPEMRQKGFLEDVQNLNKVFKHNWELDEDEEAEDRVSQRHGD